MSVEHDYLEQLRVHVVNFIDELIETFPDETDFIRFRIFINNQLAPQELMSYVTLKLLPNQELIKNKDPNFFFSSNILFEKLDCISVNHIRNIWLSKKFDKNDREVLWKWFASFVFIGNKYLDKYN